MARIPRTTSIWSVTAYPLPLLVVLGLISFRVSADQPVTDATNTISGVVVELRSGVADVPVCLCSAKSGLPLTKEAYKPLASVSQQDQIAIVLTEKRGIPIR